MDFKIIRPRIIYFFVIGFAFLCLSGCTGSIKDIAENTYYVELLNFSKDSLRQQVEQDIYGKVSYYKDGKLEILSVNYVTEDFPELHYFNNSSALPAEIPANTKKIKVTFTGDYSIDSVSYSLQKFVFKDKQWTKISDMGVLKATTTYKKAKEFAIREFSKQIVKNIVEYSYN